MCVQGTVAKSSVEKVPLGKMPLMDLPFKRAAVHSIGPIKSARDKEHLYVLALADYVTRYPDIVSLKSINTKILAEAFLNLYSQVGIQEEVLSDLGT